MYLFSHLDHQGAGGNRVGDPVFQSLSMQITNITDMEPLRCLRPLQAASGITAGGNNAIVRLQHRFRAGNDRNTVSLRSGDPDTIRDDLRRYHRTDRIMDQHNIFPVKVLFQLVYTVSDGSLTVFTAGYNIFQLGNVELIRIGLQHGLPAVYTYDGDRIDLGMTLKCLQGVHNDRPFIYRQKLLRDALSHAITGTAGNDQRNICHYYCILSTQNTHIFCLGIRHGIT